MTKPTDINTIRAAVVGQQMCVILNNLGKWGYYVTDDPLSTLDDDRPWWAYICCCCYGCCCCDFERHIIHTKTASGKDVTFVVWLELVSQGRMNWWEVISVDIIRDD